MLTCEDVKIAEDRMIEAAVSLLSFLEDRRAGERADNARHLHLTEHLKSATEDYERLVTRFTAES